MLQRYDISMQAGTNDLTIEEFTLPVSFYRRRNFFEPASQKYVLIHKVTIDGTKINTAIDKGKEALIEELRSDQFFPIRSCVEKIADKVIELSQEEAATFSEVFFNDNSLLPDEEDENDGK